VNGSMYVITGIRVAYQIPTVVGKFRRCHCCICSLDKFFG